MTTSRSTRTARSTDAFERYQGSPAELYERYFVPAIGLPFATPIVTAAALRPGERVIDVACGTGVATRIAAAQVGTTGTVAGIDGHPEMLRVARSSGPEDVTIDWREASADGLPFPDSSFDAAVCSISLQFFADKKRALREMRRVVTPGGRVSVGVPGPTPAMFEVLHDVIAGHLGVDIAAFVHAVFSLDDPAKLHELMVTAGLPDAEVNSTSMPLRLDAPADFFWQYVLSTPLAPAVASLGDDERAAMEHEIVTRWQPFVSGDHLSTEVGLILARAGRS